MCCHSGMRKNIEIGKKRYAPFDSWWHSDIGMSSRPNKKQTHLNFPISIWSTRKKLLFNSSFRVSDSFGVKTSHWAIFYRLVDSHQISSWSSSSVIPKPGTEKWFSSRKTTYFRHFIRNILFWPMGSSQEKMKQLIKLMLIGSQLIWQVASAQIQCHTKAS